MDCWLVLYMPGCKIVRRSNEIFSLEACLKNHNLTPSGYQVAVNWEKVLSVRRATQREIEMELESREDEE